MGKRRARGEGSLYKRDDGLWVGQLYLPTGKKKVKYGKTQKEVRDWLLEQKEAVSKGIYVDGKDLTLEAFLGQYMTSAANNLRPKTIDSYNYLIQNHILPELGNIKLSQLRPDQIQNFYNGKINAGLSKRTVQYMHAVLHRSLNQALRWGLVFRNVADLVDPPVPKKTTPVVFTVDQTRQFMEKIKGHRWEMIYLIAIGGGLREGEILGLYPSDITVERGVVHISKAIQYLKGRGLVLTEPKTDSGKRMVSLPEFVLQPLKAYLDSLKANQTFLFETANNTPVSPRNLLRHYHSILQEMGLPIMPFHNLRHLSASLALKAGVNPKTVQQRLGHSTISLTLDTYSHLLPGVEEEAAQKIDGIISRP